MAIKFFQSLFLSPFLLLSFSACAFSNLKAGTTQSLKSGLEEQFFAGKIQTSSVNGVTPYGPPYDSLVHRIVDHKVSTIIECVYQQGRMFNTTMKRTSNPLAFSVHDSDDSFSGVLTFADETLSSWSYDINVLKPNQGKISGQLPDYGAKIDLKEKTVLIKKIWNQQVLITERYQVIDQAMYSEQLAKNKALNPTLVIPNDCRL